MRHTTHADGTESDQVGYHTLSDEMSARRLQETVCGHWQIDTVYRVLHVTF